MKGVVIMKYLLNAFFNPDFKETRWWANACWYVAGILLFGFIIATFIHRIIYA